MRVPFNGAGWWVTGSSGMSDEEWDFELRERGGEGFGIDGGRNKTDG